MGIIADIKRGAITPREVIKDYFCQISLIWFRLFLTFQSEIQLIAIEDRLNEERPTIKQGVALWMVENELSHKSTKNR